MSQCEMQPPILEDKETMPREKYLKSAPKYAAT